MRKQHKYRILVPMSYIVFYRVCNNNRYNNNRYNNNRYNNNWYNNNRLGCVAKYFSVVKIAFQKMHSRYNNNKVQHPRYNNNNNNNNNGVLVARGGLKSLIPAMNLDTLRGRRKVDPQHKCCGKNYERSRERHGGGQQHSHHGGSARPNNLTT